MLEAAEDDRELQAELKRRFLEDILFAFNVFYWTYDPFLRTDPTSPHVPFITYPFQDEYIKAIHRAVSVGEDTITLKSRDMGCSWMWVGVVLQGWFKPGGDFLIGSRKEEYVDKLGNMDTLLEKVRYLLRRLPRWLLPAGFDRDRHMGKLQIYNPEIGTTIKGESNNAHFGSGGRYKAIVFDEFAKWEQTDEAAWRAAGPATRSRNALSSPVGRGNMFARLWLEDGGPKKLTLHWSQHPLKGEGLFYNDPDTETEPPAPANENRLPDGDTSGLPRSPWYYAECAREAADPIAIAQELDMNLVTSGRPRFNLHHVRAIREWADKPYVRGILHEGGYTPHDNGPLWVWELPVEDHDYVIGVDVGEGLPTSDFSAAVVLDRQTEDVVAMIWDRINEVDMAYEAMRLGRLYKGCDGEGAKIVVDTTGLGVATARICFDQGYGRLYYRYPDDGVRRRPAPKLGVKFTQQARLLVVSAIADHLAWAARRRLFIPEPILAECETFVFKGARPQAEEGYYDDLVMALGLALRGHIEEAAHPTRTAPPPPKPEETPVGVLGRQQFLRELEERRLGEEAWLW